MESSVTGISVVVPDYNEYDALAPVVDELVAIMGGCGRAFEIMGIGGEVGLTLPESQYM